MNLDQLFKKYHLQPLPANVRRLTNLVRNNEANADEIVRIISSDKALSARLLRVANPHAVESQELTLVEDAVVRMGMSCVLLLAMGDLLTTAVTNAFSTMLSLELKPIDPDLFDTEEEQLIGSCNFSGKAMGVVYIRIPDKLGKRIVPLLLGPQETPDDLIVQDAVGEIVNVIVGNFQSNLSHAGLECNLGLPSVIRTSSFEMEEIPEAKTEQFAFGQQDFSLLVHLNINPLLS